MSAAGNVNVREKRTRPIYAVRTIVDEDNVVTVTRSREEDGVTIRTCNEIAISLPRPIALVIKFFKL